ncbi:HupE / UreJ protein [Catalinimonas alkaloidigena]|uniref:HupE / UreJ protein n=1 Tax=Catalinimonas alkaloidigena TaxID=1075417 RepID=A0A1G9F4J1_9BACT|nr:HupE/UreJ family protein [Catalinimonas alkaloidigena]SDK83205.1 HupE / UreJ protein [Catalinimonas alkaloidigena]
MSEFSAYLALGFHHILDPHAYDHILFVIALCAVYFSRDWRQVLVVVTAFTVGHSVTLALSAFEVFRFPPQVIEILIPITILCTAIANLFVRHQRSLLTDTNYRPRLRYALALFFGFIHGMGFSTYLRSLLPPDQPIVWRLLAFNLGIELGQLVVVCAVLFISFIFVQFVKTERHDWSLFVSGMVAGVAFILLYQQL